MCGIVGWADFSRDISGQCNILTSIADKLTSRGPDSSGYWFSRHVAFGHRRLVVVDPLGGVQPMIRKKEDYLNVLIYNGE
jgi:asparagine synthase (glutamine-hydrolysing)